MEITDSGQLRILLKGLCEQLGERVGNPVNGRTDEHDLAKAQKILEIVRALSTIIQ